MTQWQMTPGEARALSKVVHLVRLRSGAPEWHLAGIEDALMKARHLAPFPDVACAAIEAARRPENRTPVVIGMEGPHWKRADLEPAWKPVDPWLLCHDCSLPEAECNRKQLGFPPDERHRYRSRGSVANTPSMKPADAARAAARAALVASKEGLCDHGVKRGVTVCRVCDAAEDAALDNPVDDDGGRVALGIDYPVAP